MDMLLNPSTSKLEKLYLEKKIIKICIGCTYCIFCKRDSEWTSPELLTFKILFHQVVENVIFRMY